MKFKSRIGGFVYFVLYGTIGIMTIPLLLVLREEFEFATILSLVFVLIISALLIWMIYGTYYIVTSNQLLYHCGPLKGHIDIDAIHTITKGETRWAGFRPATASGGLVLKYNKYDEIYISPHTNDLFIDTILQRNPGIRIEEH